MGRMEKLLECVKAKTAPALLPTLVLSPDLLVHTKQGSDPIPAAARRAEIAAFDLKMVAEGFSDSEHCVRWGPAWSPC